MKKKLTALFTIFTIALTGLTGCNDSTIPDVESSTIQVADITVDEHVKIVGLGEATHGNIEFQQLKKEVFQALLKNNDCRIFALEADFGGGMKMNEYIHGGEGTAKEAAARLGFALYRTEQMEELIQWMRDYNDGVSEEEQVSFYGFDMQRYDSSKDYLMNYLQTVQSPNIDTYKNGLADLNDDTVYDQTNSRIKAAAECAAALQEELESQKATYIQATDEKSYETAKECIHAILQNTTLQTSSTKYGTLRDQYMKERVDWIYQFEGEQLLFITGHDGHIDKSSAVKSNTSMGRLLEEEYQEDYYAIGTDMVSGEVNVVSSSGKRGNISIKNSNSLISQFSGMEDNIICLDFAKAAENPDLTKLLNKKQRMVSIGSTLDGYQKLLKAFYTIKMVPAKSYDSLIIVKDVTPTAPWPIEETEE